MRSLIERCLIILFLIIGIGNLFAQNIGISQTGGTPDNSAGLDVDFSNKGFLLPRMTTTERDAISSPALGLQIFNTTTNCLQVYVGSEWINVVCDCILPGSFIATDGSGAMETQITANWNASASATSYRLDVDDNSDFSSPLAGYNDLNVGNVTTYNVTGLSCGTTYYYRVRAVNTCGTTANTSTITYATTEGATFEDDFSTDKGWVTQDATRASLDLAGGHLDIDNIQDNTDNSMVYDLGGTVSDSQWLLRWTFTPRTEVVNNGSHLAFGLSSSNAASNVAQDALMLFSDNNINNFRTFHWDNTVWAGVQSANQPQAIDMNTTYYMQLRRTNATTFDFTVFSDAGYSTTLVTNTITIPSTIVGLRYIKYMNAINGLAGNLVSEIDDVKFWDNRITPCP